MYYEAINATMQSMIARLEGEVVDVMAAYIVIQVGGIGYLVGVTNGSGYTLGSIVSVHTYLAVRENALDLYGFPTRDDLAMFHELIKLPKIGPKTAMQILSQADIVTLKKAVQTNDPTYLSKMSGIGKKSAEKIVQGLKDVFDQGDWDGTSTHNQGDSDVIDALMALGYTQRDAQNALQKIPAEIIETNARIKQALKYIGG